MPQDTPTVPTSRMTLLTLSTGAIEAVSFLALGPVFIAMQTGNVLFLAFTAAGRGGLPPAASGVSLAAFTLGAVLGARLESGAEERRRRWLTTALVTEALLLAAAALTGWGLGDAGGTPTGRHLLVIAGLALAMGVRNVTTLRLPVPDMPTTLVTRSLTGLVAASPLGRDPALGYGKGSWARRAFSVLGMFAGGFLGAALLAAGLPLSVVILLAAVLVLLVALSLWSARPLGGRS
ncbi:YoaK family protein [Streptomyces sp. CC228A]|uniref:YoaK family protein n=1 Tax=Streptomyces sp. CC228A TaxID=2898186 RepID=UPI001F333C38|nr:YoaK family protein [Streptomyces sp. CC228A]